MVPANNLTPKSLDKPYGAARRDAITDVVDGIAQDFIGKINGVRDALQQIEAQYLESAARAKGALDDHVGVCAALNSEVTRMQTVVSGIQAQMDADDDVIPDPLPLTGQDLIDWKWDHERALRKESDE